ncbi:SusC/RagA family TonB-linked outer membrane protein [Sphingobacterium siyangense]|uniref:SusC/RagA family TonB-linked outer membrane protein n=1 Tax=Sphingobacterium siyangense TaxID=459529 RepID=UPI003C75874D
MSNSSNKLSWLLLLVLGFPSWAHSYELSYRTFAYDLQQLVDGNIKDAHGKPLAGVTVQVKGKDHSTRTDASGNFRINANTGETLLLTMIGYKKQEFLLSENGPYKVTLIESTDVLEEVVVVGYGTQKRANVTSAVTQVAAKDMNQGGVRSPLDLIRGRVAGLSITRSGGNNNPNWDTNIQLRGATTLSGTNQPLIVIDGIPGGSLNLVQQDDIESITVLKDGSAAAIYGTRANAGVVLITTKKGKAGAGQFDYSSYFAHDEVLRRPHMLTAQQYRDLKNDPTNKNANKMNDEGDEVDYFDLLLNKGNVTHYHNLSASGGTEKSNYRLSGSYSNNEGIAVANSNTQYGGRLSINHTGLKDRLHLQSNLATNIRSQNLLGGQAADFEQAIQQNPTQPVFNADGTYNDLLVAGSYYNPIARLNQETNKGERTLFSGDAKATVDITSGLTATVFGSIVRNSYQEDEYRMLASRSSIVSYRGGGYARKYSALTDTKTLEATINYGKTFYENHNIDAIVGYSYQKGQYNNMEESNSGFLTDANQADNLGAGTDLKSGLASMGSKRNNNKLVAFFGRLNYDYRGLYMVSFILRHEGSSRFGANHKWGNFPAASLGWNIKKESFMEDIASIDQFKLRVGYGVTGNQDIDNYLSLVTLGTGGQYLNNGTWFQTFGPDKNPNPDLRWEKKSELNVGADFGLWSSRLNGSIDWYQRRTTDLLGSYSTQVPPFVLSTLFTNVGELRNSGLELALNYQIMRDRDWKWDMSFTGSYQKNTLASLSDDVFKASYLESVSLPAPGSLGNAIRTIEGGPLGTYYGKRFAGFNDEGQWLFYKADGSTARADQMVEEDKAFIGNGVPKYMAALGANVSYKSWDLSVFLRGKFDFDVLNTQDLYFANKSWLGNNILSSALDKYAQLNDAPQYSDYYLQKGDFVKLDNITLGYRFKFPSSSAIRNLRVYASGQNLALISGYTGLDPEQNDTGLSTGVQGRGFYPSTRTFTFGVNVGF